MDDNKKNDNEKFSIVSDVCSDVESSTLKHCVFVEEKIFRLNTK